MRILERLNRLDRRVLPPISAALSRLGRGARRLRIVRIVAPVISLAVVLAAVYTAGRSPAPAPGPIGAVVRLGVPEGGSIPDYVAVSKADLQQLVAANASAVKPPRFYALVSMSSYLSPPDVAALFAGLSNLQVTNTIMRVPSDKQTQIIQLSVTMLPNDIERGMLATADKKQQEAVTDAALQKQVTGDSSTSLTLRAQYVYEQSVAMLEASHYRALCSCVYAAVVYGDLSALQTLAARPGVRAVEARQLTYPDLAVFLPPFPDQHDTAEPPPSSAPVPPGA